MAYSSVAGQLNRRRAALAALVFIAAALVPVPAMAAGPVKLSAGSVSPTGGSTATTFTFRVTYTSKSGVAPRTVRVIIDGVSRTMSPANPSDTRYQDGAVFRYSTMLSARRHRYDFWATDARGRLGGLPGGFLTVAAAAGSGSTSSPTPRPATGGASTAPEPTPRPTTAPRPSSGGAGSTSAGSGSSGSTGTSGGRRGSTGSGGSAAGGSTASGSAGDGPDPTAEAPLATAAGSTVAGALGVIVGSLGVSLVIVPNRASPDAAVTGAMAAGGGAVQYAPMRAAGSDATSSGGRGLDFLSATLPTYGSDSWTQAVAQTFAVSTTTSVTFAFALLFFARRRREEKDATAREQETTRTPADEIALAGYLYGPQRAAAMAAEMSLPRWRRPSVQAGRVNQRDRPAHQMAHERLTFDQGTIAMADGREFRKIRYRMVRLSDRPDEILGYELGRLDEGDEVEVLERTGSYVHIRTPYGVDGWVHRTTVGATLQPADHAYEAPPERDYAYVGPDDSLVVRLIRERSAASG